MALCWPRLLLSLLLLSIYSTRVDASISLSNELTNFIPACAQTCFVSFLENNFPTDICTENPTLDCLCSSNSTSGYTVGEGAIQCIISEVNVGFCKGKDAENDVAANAFTMCNGRENAIPNTHKTITANVIVQTSMPSIVLIAPASTSTSRSSSITSSSSLAPTPTTFAISTTGTPARASDTSAATSAEAAAQTQTATPTLTKSKIIAISVASVGGAAVLAGLLILFLCLRRRRQRSRDSDMLPFQADPGTPRFYNGFRGTMEANSTKSSNGTWGKMAPRVPPRLETSDPYMFARRSIKPDTIGLAISPERTEGNIPMEIKRSSRLLPEKPTLKLNTKQPVIVGGGLNPAPKNQFSRQSTATQFEEDDDSEDTAVDDYYGRGSSDQILEKEASNLKTIKVIPQPAFRITNPDQEKPSPEFDVKPLSVGRGIGSFSRPRPGPDYYNLQIPQSQNPFQNNRPITAGSSVYSSASNTPYTAAPSTGPLSFPLPPIQTQNQYQNKYQNQNSTQNVSRSRKSYGQAGPYDQDRGSITSFDSESSSPDKEHPRHTLMLDLSPVVESPASARSPVSYPRIPPRGRLSQQTIRMVPPPAQPDFASVFSSGGGRTQPNIQFENGGVKPWQAAEVAAARQRRLSQSQPQTQVRSQTYPIPQEPQRQETPQRTRTQPKLASPFQPQPKLQAPPQARLAHPGSAHQRQRSRDYIAPSAHFNSSEPPRSQTQLRANPHLRDTSQTPSIASFASQNSTNSSLLAKRLGAEKAAQLNLQTKTQVAEVNGKKSGWRVLGKEERDRAKEPGWMPQLVSKVAGQGGNEGVGKGRGGQGSPGLGSGGLYAGYGSEGELPRTPGWVPRLTPTRRGDELFLSVA